MIKNTPCWKVYINTYSNSPTEIHIYYMHILHEYPQFTNKWIITFTILPKKKSISIHSEKQYKSGALSKGINVNTLGTNIVFF